MARQGAARQARRGEARQGQARQAWRGGARLGGAWRGKAGNTRRPEQVYKRLISKMSGESKPLTFAPQA